MLDHVLAVLLLLILPARALWRSLTPRPESSKAGRYRATIMTVVGLLVLLTADWLLAARSVTALGLTVPTTMPALIGVGIAVTIILVLGVAMRRTGASGGDDAARARREMLPDNAVELRLFVLFAVAVGFGWEVLYRGFLLFYLASYVDLPPAVVAAAVAYGAAHGFRSWSLFAGSIASAFAFTIGYALTQNLWWLILLHVALPLTGLLVCQSQSAKR